MSIALNVVDQTSGSDCCGQCTCGAAAQADPPRQLKLISLLLDYPQDELWLQGEALREAAREVGFDAAVRPALLEFVDRLLADDPMHAQSAWTETFDRGRAMSLLMFEHIHGESRDRGQAMVDLMETYRRNGFEMDSRELPDYLPLLLEYLSLRSEEEGREWLSHLTQILSLLAARAHERQSPYALLFEQLVRHAGETPELATLRRRAATEARDDTPEAMDKVWEEEAVKFGPEAPSADACAPNRFLGERQAVTSAGQDPTLSPGPSPVGRGEEARVSIR